MQISRNTSQVEGSSELVSLIDKFASLFDKFFQTLGKGSDRNTIIYSIMPESVVDANNYKVEGNKVKDANGEEISPKDYPYRCKVVWQETDETATEENDAEVQYDIFNFYLKRNEDGKVLKDLAVKIPTVKNGQNIAEDSINEHLDEIMSKATNGDTDQCAAVDVQIKASQSLKATLKKVTSSASTDIELVSISASCDPVFAKDMIEDIVDDEEFIESLPESEEISFDIMLDDDAYDIEECEPFESCNNMFEDILQKLYQLKLTSEYISVACVGPNCTAISNQCEMIKWECDSEINWFNRLSLRASNTVPNPITLIHQIPESTEIPNIVTLNSLIEELASTLDLYWCNFDKYEQDAITKYITTWQTYIGLDVTRMTNLV